MTKLSGALFGLMVLQFILGVAGAGSAPLLGGLHVLNAIVIVAVTYKLVQTARMPQAAVQQQPETVAAQPRTRACDGS